MNEFPTQDNIPKTGSPEKNLFQRMGSGISRRVLVPLAIVTGLGSAGAIAIQNAQQNTEPAPLPGDTKVIQGQTPSQEEFSQKLTETPAPTPALTPEPSSLPVVVEPTPGPTPRPKIKPSPVPTETPTGGVGPPPAEVTPNPAIPEKTNPPPSTEPSSPVPTETPGLSPAP